MGVEFGGQPAVEAGLEQTFDQVVGVVGRAGELIDQPGQLLVFEELLGDRLYAVSVVVMFWCHASHDGLPFGSGLAVHTQTI